MSKPRLPDPWYFTLRALAESRWGIPEDQALQYVDTGYCTPSALLHKAALGLDLPGSSPHVVVELTNYRSMYWHDTPAGRVAELALPVVAYEYDKEEVKAIRIDRLDVPVFVRRSDLVLTTAAVEAVEAAGTAKSANINPKERRSLLSIIAAALDEDNDRWREHPYECARWINERLTTLGASLSTEAIAQKLRAASAETPLAEVGARQVA